MKEHFLRRFVAGLLMSIPLVVMGIGIYMLFEFLQWAGEPFFGLIDTGTAIDPLIENVLAFLGAIFLIYLLGYVADLPVIEQRISRLDRLLTTTVPGYTMIKGIIGGVVQEESLLEGLRPVLVRLDDAERIGFEIERSENGKSVVFLPNAPAASSGQVMAFDSDRVMRLHMPPHRVIELINFYGAGLSTEIRMAMDGKDQA